MCFCSSKKSGKVIKDTPRDITLTYFDFGGRAESIRLTFLIGKVKFEDKRLTSEQWGKMKGTEDAKFGQLPILEVDGQIFAQSRAILKYAGRLAGNLYPQEYLEQLEVDEGVDLVEEIFQKLLHAIYGFQDDGERAQYVKQLQSEILPRYLGYYEDKIQDNKGAYYGRKLSVSDIYLYVVTTIMYGGGIKNFKYDLKQHKKVNALIEKIKGISEVKKYFNTHYQT